MNKLLNNLNIAAILMILMPIGFYLFDYQWDLQHNLDNFGETQFLIIWTQMASPPYAIAIELIFIGIILLFKFLLKLEIKYINLILLCILSVMTTQAIKSSVKKIVAEPRPFVVQMQKNGYIHDLQADFYDLKKKKQREVVKHYSDFYFENYFEKNNINQEDEDREKIKIITQFQSQELGYSFPSGHTIFAVSWLMIIMGLIDFIYDNLNPINQKIKYIIYIIQVFMLIWTWVILYSRVRLGMHFPVDLLGSIIFSWIIHLILFKILILKLELELKIKNKKV